MRRKKNKGNLFVFILVSVIVLLSVGYAIFAETLNIAGTAQTTGNFNVEFFSTSITSSSLCTPTSTISADKNSITISIPDLQEPGATAKINVVVKNTGNINAVLSNATVTGNTDPDIVVSFPTFTTGTVLAAGLTYTFDIDVTWDSNSQTSGKTVDFTVALNYTQEV